jgi:hypothetical protein
MASERHPLDPDAVLRAHQPAQLGTELQAPGAEVQMAPGRLDLLLVVTVRRGERAQRAAQPTTPQRDRDDHPVGVELNTAHPDSIQTQQARECPVTRIVVLLVS